METTIVYWGYIGIMEKEMETTIVYWGSTHCDTCDVLTAEAIAVSWGGFQRQNLSSQPAAQSRRHASSLYIHGLCSFQLGIRHLL